MRKLSLKKVEKGHAQTPYNQLAYCLELNGEECIKSAKLKRNGSSRYFICSDNVKFEFDCVGQLVEIIIK